MTAMMIITIKLKNPQKYLYFDRLSERHAIREGSGESTKIADSGEKGTMACEQSTISCGQTYKLIRSNLLSLTVGIDRIDATVIRTTNQTFKVNKYIHIQQNHVSTL